MLNVLFRNNSAATMQPVYLGDLKATTYREYRAALGELGERSSTKLPTFHIKPFGA